MKVVLCNFNKAKYDGRQSDIWSCGVMLYLMVMGAYPFQDGANPAMFSKTVKVPPLPQQTSFHFLRHLFLSMWQFPNKSMPLDACPAVGQCMPRHRSVIMLRRLCATLHARYTCAAPLQRSVVRTSS